MKYTYEDVVTAKDILTGHVKKEDIIGKKGWFLDCIPQDMSLNTIMRLTGGPETLKDFKADAFCSFVNDKGCVYIYFIPEKGPSYKERQAEWIKANNIKEGDKVKILRKAESHEDGWDDIWVGDEVGKIGVIDVIYPDNIRVKTNTESHWYPYFVLEKVEDEPEYIPYDLSDAEHRELLRDEWVVSKKTGSEGKIIGFHRLASGEWTADIGWGINATADGLLDGFTFSDGSPVGKLKDMPF